MATFPNFYSTSNRFLLESLPSKQLSLNLGYLSKFCLRGKQVNMSLDPAEDIYMTANQRSFMHSDASSSSKMDCSGNENVCSVKKENNQDYYRIHTIWNDNGFRINIASKNGAWTGEMTPENIQKTSNELKVDPEKYLAECKEVLTSDDGKKGYFYSVENGSFIWKKIIDEDSGMKIRMGSVMVQPVSFADTVQNIIEVALNCKKNLNKQLNSLKEEKKKDLQRISDLQKKFDELCDKKNLMETDLYSKFLLLLNSKKRKIQELEDGKMGIKEFSQSSEKCSIENKMEEKNIIEAYEMDTEDEEDAKEKRNFKLNYKKCTDSAKEQVFDDCPEEENNYMNGKTVNDVSTCSILLESHGKSTKSTSDINVTHENSTISGKNNINRNSDNVEVVNNTNKSFPATKADILDFFFGPTA